MAENGSKREVSYFKRGMRGMAATLAAVSLFAETPASAQTRSEQDVQTAQAYRQFNAQTRDIQAGLDQEFNNDQVLMSTVINGMSLSSILESATRARMPQCDYTPGAGSEQRLPTAAELTVAATADGGNVYLLDDGGMLGHLRDAYLTDQADYANMRARAAVTEACGRRREASIDLAINLLQIRAQNGDQAAIASLDTDMQTLQRARAVTDIKTRVGETLSNLRPFQRLRDRRRQVTAATMFQRFAYDGLAQCENGNPTVSQILNNNALDGGPTVLGEVLAPYETYETNNARSVARDAITEACREIGDAQ